MFVRNGICPSKNRFHWTIWPALQIIWSCGKSQGKIKVYSARWSLHAFSNHLICAFLIRELEGLVIVHLPTYPQIYMASKAFKLFCYKKLALLNHVVMTHANDITIQMIGTLRYTTTADCYYGYFGCEGLGWQLCFLRNFKQIKILLYGNGVFSIYLSLQKWVRSNLFSFYMTKAWWMTMISLSCVDLTSPKT